MAEVKKVGVYGDSFNADMFQEVQSYEPEAFDAIRKLKPFHGRKSFQHGGHSAYQLFELIKEYDFFEGVTREGLNKAFAIQTIRVDLVEHHLAREYGIESGHYSPKGRRGFHRYTLRQILRAAAISVWRKF